MWCEWLIWVPELPVGLQQSPIDSSYSIAPRNRMSVAVTWVFKWHPGLPFYFLQNLFVLFCLLFFCFLKTGFLFFLAQHITALLHAHVLLILRSHFLTSFLSLSLALLLMSLLFPLSLSFWSDQKSSDPGSTKASCPGHLSLWPNVPLVGLAEECRSDVNPISHASVAGVGAIPPSAHNSGVANNLDFATGVHVSLGERKKKQRRGGDYLGGVRWWLRADYSSEPVGKSALVGSVCRASRHQDSPIWFAAAWTLQTAL